MQPKILILIIFIHLALISFSQKPITQKFLRSVEFNNGIGIKADVFQHATTVDTVDFLITKKAKSDQLIVFIPGSLPYPSFMENESGIHLLWSQTLLEQPNSDLLCFGKPGIPVLLNQNELDSNYHYNNAQDKPFPYYLLNDNLDWYVKNYSDALNKLLKKRRYKKITVIGGSQGARIALELALNKNITHLVLMSCDPLGRIATMIDAEYSDFENRNMKRINTYIETAKSNNNSTDTLRMNNTYLSWQSFSKPMLITLSRLKIPVHIVYGTMDKNCPNCYVYDLLPNYLPNISVAKYEDLDHIYINSKGEQHHKMVHENVFKWLNEN